MVLSAGGSHVKTIASCSGPAVTAVHAGGPTSFTFTGKGGAATLGANEPFTKNMKKTFTVVSPVPAPGFTHAVLATADW